MATGLLGSKLPEIGEGLREPLIGKSLALLLEEDRAAEDATLSRLSKEGGCLRVLGTRRGSCCPH